MFSVVITTKNRIDFLKRAVTSVLCNTIQPTDIIVVNDNGENIDSIKDLTNINGLIKVINNDVSMGANYCRNLGVYHTKNEYVFLLDDDDYLEEDSFKKRFDIISKNSNIGLCFTGIKVVFSNNLNLVQREVFPSEYSDYFSALISSGNIIGSTSRVVINKKHFNAAGMFDESLSCLQDYDLWLRMAKISEIAHDGNATVLYTIHDSGNQISSKYKKYLESGLYLYEKNLKLITENNLNSSFLANIYLRVALAASSNSFITQSFYAMKSFLAKPSMKAVLLIFIPKFILKSIRPFA